MRVFDFLLLIIVVIFSLYTHMGDGTLPLSLLLFLTKGIVNIGDARLASIASYRMNEYFSLSFSQVSEIHRGGLVHFCPHFSRICCVINTIYRLTLSPSTSTFTPTSAWSSRRILFIHSISNASIPISSPLTIIKLLSSQYHQHSILTYKSFLSVLGISIEDSALQSLFFTKEREQGIQNPLEYIKSLPVIRFGENDEVTLDLALTFCQEALEGMNRDVYSVVHPLLPLTLLYSFSYSLQFVDIWSTSALIYPRNSLLRSVCLFILSTTTFLPLVWNHNRIDSLGREVYKRNKTIFEIIELFRVCSER